MNPNVEGLNERDMGVLRHYAQQGNRELYWNYLAQTPGNDGYGTLALGVVRNDNMPGKMANAYAQEYARSANGRTLSERGWDNFGENLVRLDLEQREARMRAGRPDQALNLPVSDVQRAHDRAFQQVGISPNAWTPRELLEAARRQGGDQAAQSVWGNMLDNDLHGTRRAFMTTTDIPRYFDDKIHGLTYGGRLLAAFSTAGNMLNNVNPDVVGASSLYYTRDRTNGEWSMVSTGSGMGIPAQWPETNARTLADLNDTREVRLERAEERRQFHPNDPYRNIARSPGTLAEADTIDGPTRFAAAAPERANRAIDPYGIDVLPPAARERHEQALAQAQRLGLPEQDTQNLAMAMTRQVSDNALMLRIDDIVAVRGAATDGGDRIHMMYKPLGDKSPIFNDYVDLNPAIATPAHEHSQQIVRSQEQRQQTVAQTEDRNQQRGGQQVG